MVLFMLLWSGKRIDGAQVHAGDLRYPSCFFQERYASRSMNPTAGMEYYVKQYNIECISSRIGSYRRRIIASQWTLLRHSSSKNKLVMSNIQMVTLLECSLNCASGPKSIKQKKTETI